MTDPPERGARERILAAAVDRIAMDGIDDMRIARVATHAGVSTSLVHYHFETREALLAEALEYSYEMTATSASARPRASRRPRPTAAGHDRPVPAVSRALRKDWILYVELWLRAVRHPELHPTGVRLYGRMRDWLADGISACGSFERARPRRSWPTGCSRSATASG